MIRETSILLGIGLIVASPAFSVRAQMPPTKVVVAEARTIDAPETITLVGTVEPARRSHVASEIAGTVDEMSVRQGDFVEAGGPLCRLDSETLALRLEEAKAELSALTDYHDELLAGTRTATLTQLKAMLDETDAEFERWQFEQQRVEDLYEDSQSNAKELVDARADFRRAERRKIAANAAYELGVEGPRKEVIARAAHEAAAQQAVVNRIESELRKTTIQAPFTGYVVKRTIEIGEWLAAGGEVLEMIELASVLVCVDTPEAAFPYVTVGESVRVTVDALERSFEGTIKHVIRQADPRAHTFPIEVEMDNKEGLFAAGMFARVTLPSGPREPVIAVPKDAIVEKNGISHVGIVMPGQGGGMAAMLTPVTVGADVANWIAITSGNIQPGTPVVTHGNEGILPFPMPVLIVDDKGTPIPTPQGDLQPQDSGGP